MRLIELSKVSRNKLSKAGFKLDKDINEIQTYASVLGYFEYAPLHYAAMTGDLNLITDLCTHGANINAEAPLHDETPLTWAAERGRAAAVNLLISFGADLDKTVSLRDASDKVVSSVPQGEYALQKAEKYKKPSCLWSFCQKILLWRELDYKSTIQTIQKAKNKI